MKGSLLTRLFDPCLKDRIETLFPFSCWHTVVCWKDVLISKMLQTMPSVSSYFFLPCRKGAADIIEYFLSIWECREFHWSWKIRSKAIRDVISKTNLLHLNKHGITAEYPGDHKVYTIETRHIDIDIRKKGTDGLKI